MQNLLAAWEEFRAGKRSKPDVLAFEAFAEENLFELQLKLKNGLWRPMPYKAFNISDPKPRRIHKACVPDRVVHQAVFRVLYPIFDGGFIFDSYACRLDKGTHRAVKRLETFCRRLSKNYRLPVFALKCDIRKFFDSVDHGILEKLIAKKVSDEKVLRLVKVIIQSFFASPGKGLPLGNVTSQLFANVYMNEFDEFIKHELKIKDYIRYTDDFVIVSRDKSYLEKAIKPLAEFLRNSLRLELHPEKVIFRKLSQGIDFLGYVVLTWHIALRTKTKHRIFKKLIHKRRLLENEKIFAKTFNQTIQSYLGILKHCNGYNMEDSIRKNFMQK